MNNTTFSDLLDEVLNSPTLNEIEKQGAVLRKIRHRVIDDGQELTILVTLYLYKHKKYAIAYKCSTDGSRQCVTFKECDLKIRTENDYQTKIPSARFMYPLGEEMWYKCPHCGKGIEANQWENIGEKKIRRCPYCFSKAYVGC